MTDSPGDIRGRRSLSSHFPETIPLELARYPSPETLQDEMERAGLEPRGRREVETRSSLTSSAPYRKRAYSSLHLVEEAVFRARLTQLEVELAAGPVETVSPYTLLWATVTPGSGSHTAGPMPSPGGHRA